MCCEQSKISIIKRKNSICIYFANISLIFYTYSLNYNILQKRTLCDFALHNSVLYL